MGLIVEPERAVQKEYCLNVDVRFHVKVSNEEEAWKICREKTEQLHKLLRGVADDFVAADVWEYTQ